MQVNFQDFAAGSSRNLTLEADIGNASINITSGATGAITMGNAGGGGAFGNLILADNLDIVHNGSGILLLNRPVQGAFDITKTGTGTLQLSAFNTFTGALKINEGTVLVSP
jgi:autotransporter-associated beta strand protein